MLVSDLIALSLRTSGVLGVGQTALPQDLTDAQSMLMLMMQQWRQKRWLVYRLDWQLFPVTPGKATYSIGPAGADVVTPGKYRPANIQSCYLRQEIGSGPQSYPVDFPINILKSRQEYDLISLKNLQSWPATIYYDPTIPNATLYIWPIPNQSFFSLYIAWHYATDLAGESGLSVDMDTVVPSEDQLAIMYNLALLLTINYKLPRDQNLEAEARATLNVMRQSHYALQPLRMPSALRATGTRVKNPYGGFYYPEVSAGIPINAQLG